MRWEYREITYTCGHVLRDKFFGTTSGIDEYVRQESEFECSECSKRMTEEAGGSIDD